MTRSLCRLSCVPRVCFFPRLFSRRIVHAAWLALYLAPVLPAAAHEYWVQATPYSAAVGASSNLTLQFGEYYKGEITPFVLHRFTRFEHYSQAGKVDLEPRVPRGVELGRVPLAIDAPGTHMVAFDAAANYLTLPADKFFDYLHDEGLDNINRIRAAMGHASRPGRERYFRNVKTLLRGGGASDATYAVQTGQRMELLPMSDPLAMKPGDTLALGLLFDGKPLAGALLKAWYKRNGQLTLIRAVSDAAGQVSVSLPWAGEWMLSVVHMIPSAGSVDQDWDSYWGNLSFELLP
ncbi:MAG: DUF4198 domain-containing protein [Janthinobacterium lividum]